VRIVLVGAESAGVRVFRRLMRTEAGLVGVVANPPSPDDRGGTVWSATESTVVKRWPAPMRTRNARVAYTRSGG
jgi:methionyl-tRNA formyltransferase